ncbi:hypothetical protein BJ944DRAFT_97421 [Cunninghamella echinulata]|nr:hypothetical protein BJ944DRAFT_97421 [Cunninghamella echinulata]
MGTILKLPAEIVDHILFYNDYEQLVVLRQVCKQWQYIIDRPLRWQTVMLNYPPSPNTLLWQLKKFQYLMEPHLSSIRSLHITGVRDTLVRYILKKCILLEDLTIEGWRTLSYHAIHLSKNKKINKLRNLKCLGRGNQIFILEPFSFANFLYSCPCLTLLHIDQCELVLHADTFLTYLQKHRIYLPELTSLVLSLQQPSTWSQQHIQILFTFCPNLKYLQLESSPLLPSTNIPPTYPLSLNM